MVTKYREETAVVKEDKTFTDWVLDLPLKIFFWGCLAIVFACWLITIAFLFVYLKLVMH